MDILKARTKSGGGDSEDGGDGDDDDDDDFDDESNRDAKDNTCNSDSGVNGEVSDDTNAEAEEEEEEKEKKNQSIGNCYKCEWKICVRKSYRLQKAVKESNGNGINESDLGRSGSESEGRFRKEEDTRGNRVRG